MKQTQKQIEQWMKRNVFLFIDPKTGEINCTSMVEEWDRDASTGDSTLDPDHPAWDAAFEVAKAYENERDNRGYGG